MPSPCSVPLHQGCTRPAPLLICQSTCPPIFVPPTIASHAAPLSFLASHLSLYDCPLCSPLPSWSCVLLCCRPCLSSLTSWCQPVRWAWDAALQPLSEASPTSSPSQLPEHDLEVGSGWLPQALGWRRVLADGLVGGQSGSDPGSQLLVSRHPHFSTTGPCVLLRLVPISCSFNSSTICLKSFPVSCNSHASP